MYLMYVDESGDTGLNGSPTRFFALSGIVVHESKWREFLETLISFKKQLRYDYNLPVRGEIHASEFISTRAFDLDRHVRLAILRNTLDELAKIDYISITNVVVDKFGKPEDYDVFNNAWGTLFQRFENTLENGNFPGEFQNDHGLVITDATAGQSLARLVRKMAVINYIPSKIGGRPRNIPIVRVIEDPYGKDSAETLPIQMADVAAYFLQQKCKPNSYVKRKGAKNYFDRLLPVLNTRASNNNRYGVVKL